MGCVKIPSELESQPYGGLLLGAYGEADAPFSALRRGERRLCGAEGVLRVDGRQRVGVQRELGHEQHRRVRVGSQCAAASVGQLLRLARREEAAVWESAPPGGYTAALRDAVRRIVDVDGGAQLDSAHSADSQTRSAGRSRVQTPD